MGSQKRTCQVPIKESFKEWIVGRIRSDGNPAGVQKIERILEEAYAAGAKAMIVEVVKGEGLTERQMIDFIVHTVHFANKKWWVDIDTGEPKERNVGELLMLTVTKLAEAMEGHRKNMQDDKLPHRRMFEVELADALIRIADIAGGMERSIDVSKTRELGEFAPIPSWVTDEDYPKLASKVTHLSLPWYCINCLTKAETTYLTHNFGPFCRGCAKEAESLGMVKAQERVVRDLMDDLVDCCYEEGESAGWRLCLGCRMESRCDATLGDKTHEDNCRVDAAEAWLRAWQKKQEVKL